MVQFQGTSTSIQIRSSKSIMKIESEFVCVYLAYLILIFNQTLQNYLMAFRQDILNEKNDCMTFHSSTHQTPHIDCVRFSFHLE